jgi:hypothetical protein
LKNERVTGPGATKHSLPLDGGGWGRGWQTNREFPGFFAVLTMLILPPRPLPSREGDSIFFLPSHFYPLKIQQSRKNKSVRFPAGGYGVVAGAPAGAGSAGAAGAAAASGSAAGFNTISTRRLRCLFSGVSFGATGRYIEKPTASSRFGSI